MKMNIRKGDTVLVITGKDKGKSGKVLETNPKDGKVLVEGINIVTKHKKPRSQQDKGGIIKKPAMIESSNVQVICAACGKATRVAHKQVDGKNVRICKKCGASLDKEFAKTVKKDAKKAEKTAKKEEKTAQKPEINENEVKTEAKKAAPKTAAKPAAKTTAKSAATTKKSKSSDESK